MAITKQITQAPEAPQRNDPDTFADKADQFVAWLENLPDEINEWADQANSTETNINNLEQQTQSLRDETEGLRDQTQLLRDETEVMRDEVSATANASVYDNSTTYNYPDTVIGSDGHTYRCLGTNVQGDDPVNSSTGNWLKITTSEDEVTTWINQEVDERFGDVHVVSLASSDLTLTEDYRGWVVVTDGTHNLKLADATSFSRLGWQFTITNESVDTVTVRDYAGNLIAVVLPSEKVEIYLYDKTTSEGKWFIKQENLVGALLRPKNDGLSGSVSVSGTGAYRVGDAIALDEDKFFTVTGGSSLYGRVFQVDSDKQTITEIASLQIVDYAVSVCPRVCKLSDSKLFVLFDKNDTTNDNYTIYMTVLNWDGTNLTIDVPPTALRSSQSQNNYAGNDCATITESEVFVFDCWYDGSNWHHEGVVVQYDSENKTLSVRTRATAYSRYYYIYALVENSNSFWVGNLSSSVRHYTYDGSSITEDGNVGNGFFNPVLFQNKPLGLYWYSDWNDLDYADFEIRFNVYDSSSLSYETKASYWKLGLRQIFTRNLSNSKILIFFGYLHKNKYPEIIRLTKNYSVQLFRTVNEDSYLGSYFVQLTDKLLVDATQFKVIELTQPLWSK